jgi:hypothetical protein
MKYKLGQTHKCPICGNPKAKVVWKRENGTAIGVKCARSHEHKRNCVVLIEIGDSDA